MLIFNIILKGVNHKLKYPIEIIENESWLGGKHMHVLEIKDFRLLSYHDSLEVSRRCMEDLINLIINSTLFEDYSDPAWEKSLRFQNMTKRYVYG